MCRCDVTCFCPLTLTSGQDLSWRVWRLAPQHPPPSWRHKELKIKISLFYAPSYEKWEPFLFPEWHGGLGRASRSQQPCVGWSVEQFLLHWTRKGISNWLWETPPPQPCSGFQEKKCPILTCKLSMVLALQPYCGLEQMLENETTDCKNLKKLSVHEGKYPAILQTRCHTLVKMCGRMAHNWLPPSLLWPPQPACLVLCWCCGSTGFVSCPKSVKGRADELWEAYSALGFFFRPNSYLPTQAPQE